MRSSMTTIVGIILIVIGIGVLAYQRIHYTTEEKVAQIGSIEVTAEKEKSVSLPPILGGLALAAGLVLVVVGRKK